MTQDEVLKMARQAGLIVNSPYLMPHDNVLRGIEAFAKLVAQKAKEQEYADLIRIIEANILEEREACHALRQTLPNPYTHCQVSAHVCDMAFAEYGRAIRARGEA